MTLIGGGTTAKLRRGTRQLGYSGKHRRAIGRA